MAASHRKTGVNEARREEIHNFLVQRFIDYHKTATRVRHVISVLHVGAPCFVHSVTIQVLVWYNALKIERGMIISRPPCIRVLVRKWPCAVGVDPLGFAFRSSIQKALATPLFSSLGFILEAVTSTSNLVDIKICNLREGA